MVLTIDWRKGDKKIKRRLRPFDQEIVKEEWEEEKTCPLKEEESDCCVGQGRFLIVRNWTWGRKVGREGKYWALSSKLFVKRGTWEWRDQILARVDLRVEINGR